jgi:DNA-directed RNA polymerase specialized sigma subunit
MTEQKKSNAQKKQYLQSYIMTVRRESELNDEIMMILLDHALPKAISYGEKSGAGPRFDLSDVAAKVDELQRDLFHAHTQCIERRRDITLRIESMSSETEKLLLHLRYIRGFTFDEVADKMQYSRRHVIRLHGNALLHFPL